MLMPALINYFDQMKCVGLKCMITILKFSKNLASLFFHILNISTIYIGIMHGAHKNNIWSLSLVHHYCNWIYCKCYPSLTEVRSQMVESRTILINILFGIRFHC